MTKRQLSVLSPKQQGLFDFLVAYARDGKRCPTAEQLKYHRQPHNLTQLATHGYIRIEVFTLNWRVVTILTGKYRGKSTAPCPHGGSGKPYRTIDIHGDSMAPRRQSTRAAKNTANTVTRDDGSPKTYRGPAELKLPWEE